MNDKDYKNDTWYGDKANQVHGDILGGEKVNLDKIGSSSIIAVGRETQNHSQQKKNIEYFEYSYQSVYRAIQSRPADPNVEKHSLEFLARRVHDEVAQEAVYDQNQISRLLKQLFNLAPDIFKVVTTILLDPQAGLSFDVQQFVKKVRDECQPDIQINQPIDTYLEKELSLHNLSPVESKQMRDDLQELRLAVDTDNIPPVRQLLQDLTQVLPGMKRPLRHWLVESPGTSPAIKILARNYLD